MGSVAGRIAVSKEGVVFQGISTLSVVAVEVANMQEWEDCRAEESDIVSMEKLNVN